MSSENGNIRLEEIDHAWLTKLLMEIKKLEACRDNFLAYLYHKNGLEQERYVLDLRSMEFRPRSENNG
jgi:hypothetical protein